MVDTKDQSNAVVYCVCYVVCRHIQRKLLKCLGCLLISLHACIDSVNMQHTLDLAKVAFLTYQFLAGRFS